MHSNANVFKFIPFGAWRSLEAHLNGVQGVAGSNPVAPTVKGIEISIPLIFMRITSPLNLRQKGISLMTIAYDIVIPAYNAQKSLPKILHSILELKILPNTIFIVDDGSTDQTAQVVVQFEPVELIQLGNNNGKGAALRIGIDKFLKNKQSDFLLIMDADGQHPVASIPEFLDRAKTNNTDIIIGHRFEKIGVMPLARIFSNTVSSIITSWVTGIKIPDSQCGFRLMKRSVLETIQLTEDGFQVETELIVKAAKKGFTFNFVPIPTIYNGQKSYIKHVNDTIRFMKIILREILTP